MARINGKASAAIITATAATLLLSACAKSSDEANNNAPEHNSGPSVEAKTKDTGSAVEDVVAEETDKPEDAVEDRVESDGEGKAKRGEKKESDDAGVGVGAVAEETKPEPNPVLVEARERILSIHRPEVVHAATTEAPRQRKAWASPVIPRSMQPSNTAGLIPEDKTGSDKPAKVAEEKPETKPEAKKPVKKTKQKGETGKKKPVKEQKPVEDKGKPSDTVKPPLVESPDFDVEDLVTEPEETPQENDHVDTPDKNDENDNNDQGDKGDNSGDSNDSDNPGENDNNDQVDERDEDVNPDNPGDSGETEEVEPVDDPEEEIDVEDSAAEVEKALNELEVAKTRLALAQKAMEDHKVSVSVAVKNLEDAKNGLVAAQSRYDEAVKRAVAIDVAPAIDALANAEAAKSKADAHVKTAYEARNKAQKAKDDAARKLNSLLKSSGSKVDYAKLSVAQKQEVISFLMGAMINDYRIQAGLNPLPMADSHNAQSLKWSEKMVKDSRLSHDSARHDVDGASYENVLYNFAKENSHDPVEVAHTLVTQWINSPGHHKGMMSSDVMGQGVAVKFDPNTRRIYSTWRGYTDWDGRFDKGNAYMPTSLEKELTGKKIREISPRYSGMNSNGQVTSKGNKLKKTGDISQGVKNGSPKGVNVSTGASKAEVDKARANLNKAQKNLDAKNADVSKAESNALTAAKKLQDATEAKDKVTAEKEKANKQVDVEETNVTEAKDKVKKAESDLAERNEETAVLEAKVKQEQKEVDSKQVAYDEAVKKAENKTPEIAPAPETTPTPTPAPEAVKPVQNDQVDKGGQPVDSGNGGNGGNGGDSGQVDKGGQVDDNDKNDHPVHNDQIEQNGQPGNSGKDEHGDQNE